MTLHPCIVGIDISKATLDIFTSHDSRSRRIANSRGAIEPLLEEWQRSEAFVVFEATGSYDAQLRRCLAAADIAHARVNPTRARHFAHYAGFAAKTDRLDARMLAEMGRHRELEPEAPADPERDALRALSRRRDQLVQCRKIEQTRLAEAEAGIERDSIEDHIAFLKAAIAAIDKAIAAALAKSDRLRAAAARLRRIPGIGPVTATVLLALMPELGSRSPKTIAALAGLAPINRDSGKRLGQRCVAGGRKRVRDALYMAAVAASRSHSQLAAFYKNLRAAGKPPKLAFVALARKLLTIANAIMRDGSAFRHA